ncbi:MAG: hypothetical protein RR233_03425 [Clostridiales bacterium]
MKNVYQFILIIFIGVSLFFTVACTDENTDYHENNKAKHSSAQTPNHTSTPVKTKDKQATTVLSTEDSQKLSTAVAPYLKEGEFLGYGVKTKIAKTTYIYGLIYTDKDPDHIKTPLTAVITLKGEKNPQLIVKDKLNFKEYGTILPFENRPKTPCIALAVENQNTFIQIIENSLSEYMVIHQVLVDKEGLLSTAEATETTGEFFTHKNQSYTIWQNQWCTLNTGNNTISYNPIAVEKFRPKVKKTDTVISYTYLDNTPKTPVFKLNRKKLNPAQDEFNNTRAITAIKCQKGNKIYFFQTSQYPMNCTLNYTQENKFPQNGDLAAIAQRDNGTAHIGYTVFTIGKNYPSAYLFAQYFTDYTYNFPFILK